MLKNRILCLKKNVTKKIEKDKKDYIDYIIEKCESQKSFINKWFIDVNIPDRDQSDKLFTVRLSIKKDYPGVLKYFDERNPTNLDVVNKIENVIRFYINDNNSFGNSDNTAKFAYKYLEVSGYTELPGFNAAWELLAGLYQLPGSKELFDENCLDEDIV